MPSSATAGRRALPIALFCFVTPLAAALAADLGQIVTGDPPSVRQTERLAKKAEKMIDAVERAQVQIHSTLAAYDALVFGSASDLRPPYRALEKQIARCDQKREAVRLYADEARKEATDYFRAWAGSLPLIEGDDLRARSEARLRDSRARFDSIVEAGLHAAKEYEPFIGRLRDQWTYLGHDLNPSGLESLRPDAKQLGEDGNQLLVAVDQSLRQAREYVTSIRSRQPPPPPPPPAPEPKPEPAPTPGG